MTTGSVLAQFTITISQAVSEQVAVEWHTADGTALAGVDYAAAKGTVLFAPGQTAKTVDILVHGRAVGTEDRSFFVEMLPPTNAILGASIGECIIHVDTTGSTPVTQIIVPTGPQGLQGDSAYQAWLDLGNTGTEEDFINSLKPSAEEIAEEVAPILNVSNSPLTAEGTETLSKPDTMTGKRLARRVAYVGAAKVATVVLADGDNLITHAALSGDAVDFNSISLYPRILRGTVVISPEWSVEPGDKILIKSAVAGDVLHVCQYDVISERAVRNVVEPIISAALAPVGSQAFEALRRSYAEAGCNVAGTFRAGFTIVNANDVGIDETTGKGFTGPAGPVAAGTDPASGGFVDVSDKINPVVSSVAELKAIHAVVGCTYHTKGYYSAGDGGGAEYVAMPSGAISPDGYGDHLAANGVVLQLASQPTDLNHGVKVSGTFAAADAWRNRNALQAMLRNPRWGYFELVANGTYYVLGSVHPLRDNITVHHKAGCKIIGRYSDASIPNSITSQGGHLFGFAKFVGPDNGQFLPVTGYTSKVNYILDGDISTEFNAGHAQIHNNNCIGYYKADDCHVTGFGGVSESDHRGVNFDGLAIDCHIDIGYAKGTADEPLVMKSDSAIPNRCTVKVGHIKDVPFGGPNQAIAVRVQDCANVEVKIGSFVWDGVTKPQLVGAFNCTFVGVDAGDVDGASQLLRQYETLDSEVSVRNVKNTQYGIVRAGVAASTMRSALLTGVKRVDSTFIAAYRAEVNNGTFATLSIHSNNFSGASTTFKYYDNRTSPGIPLRYDLHDNISPAGFPAVDFNSYQNGITENLVTPGQTSFTVNYKSPDWLYSVMTVIVDAGGLRYLVDIDLRNRDLSSVNYTYPAGPATITSARSGSTMTLTVTGGTFQIATMHN